MKLIRPLIILLFVLAANVAWAADDDIYNDEPVEETQATLESSSPNGQEIISLIEQISGGSHMLNMEAVDKLVAYGDEAVDYLAQAYWNSDGSDSIRTYAMIALKRLGHKDAVSTAARDKLSHGEAAVPVERQHEEEDGLSELLMLNETLRRREDVAMEEGGGTHSPPGYEQSGRFSSVDDAMIEAEVQRRLESFREGFRQGYEEGSDNNSSAGQVYPYGGVGYPAPVITSPAQYYYNDLYPVWYGGSLVKKDGGSRITVTRKNSGFLTDYESYMTPSKWGKSAFWDSMKPTENSMSEQKRKLEEEEERLIEEELKAKGRR